MRKARESAKNEFLQQIDGTPSQETQPMATTRYPKRALADDREQGSAQSPQATAIVRTRSGAHHHPRREPAAEAASAQDVADVKTEASPSSIETATNGGAIAPDSTQVAPISPEPRPKPDGRNLETAAASPPAAPASSLGNGRHLPPTIVSETGALNLKALKGAKITELAHIARDYNIDGAPNMRKQEMIFSILQAQAQRNGSILGEGVLEILPDGFGFLRAPDGTITTFDAPGAFFLTLPTAINPIGTITGNSDDAVTFTIHGFVRALNGTITTFDPPGAVETDPFGINQMGTITGDYFDASFTAHGFVRAPNGTITTFDPPGAVNGTFPAAINPTGTITGSYFDASFAAHGFVRAPNGTITMFDAPEAVNGTFAAAINTMGTITGDYGDASSTFHGFVRAPNGTITTFDPPGAQEETLPGGITPGGVITGTFFDSSQLHGFVRIP